MRLKSRGTPVCSIAFFSRKLGIEKPTFEFIQGWGFTKLMRRQAKRQ